jgi:hypothetical protein
VERGAGAHLAGEAQIVAPLEPAALDRLGETDAIDQIRLGLVQPVEIERDREMLGDVGFPRGVAAALGFDPSGHAGHPVM